MRPRTSVYFASSENSSDLVVINVLLLRSRVVAGRPTAHMVCGKLRVSNQRLAAAAVRLATQLAPVASLLEQGTKIRPEVIRDDPIAFRRRVNAVGLVEPGVASHTV